MVLRWTAALVLVLATSAPSAAQTMLSLFGKKLLIRDGKVETNRKIVVAMTGLVIDAAAIDPVTNGAVLHVFNSAGTADSACMSLPASGWKASGSALTYEDPGYTNGPCRLVKVKTSKFVKAVCKAKVQPITYTLDEPAQGAVGVRFTSGDRTYCADFGGSGPKDVPNKKFLAKNAAAPLTCSTPPAACP